MDGLDRFARRWLARPYTAAKLKVAKKKQKKGEGSDRVGWAAVCAPAEVVLDLADLDMDLQLQNDCGHTGVPN